MFGTRVLRASLLLLASSACYETSAPTLWLPSPSRAATDRYGGWAVVTTTTGHRFAGELMAVTADTMHVLRDRVWHAIPLDRIASARVEGFETSYGPIVGWTILGAASTLSHGIVLILTAPAWFLSGTIAAASVSYSQQVSWRDRERFRAFARFPQGLPTNLDRAQIGIKVPLQD